MALAWTCLALAAATLYTRHKAEPRLQRIAADRGGTPAVAVVAEAMTVLLLLALTGTALTIALTT